MQLTTITDTHQNNESYTRAIYTRFLATTGFVHFLPETQWTCPLFVEVTYFQALISVGPSCIL